jgi:hypothetical protein
MREQRRRQEELARQLADKKERAAMARSKSAKGSAKITDYFKKPADAGTGGDNS